MKVLLVITKGGIGGAQRVTRDLAFGFKENGVDVSVASGENGMLKKDLEKSGVRFLLFSHLKRSHNPLMGLFFIFEVKKLLNKERFDVVHFHSSNALIGAVGARLSSAKPKIVFTLHGMSVLDRGYKRNRFLKIFYWLYFKLLLLLVDKPVFVSKNNLESALRLRLLRKGAGKVIYNGIDLIGRRFSSREESRRFFADTLSVDVSDKYIIGSIGRLSYAKNYEFLIGLMPEILRVNDKAVLVIIGGGAGHGRYNRLAEKLGLSDSVFLAGEVEGASRFMKGFDLFVLPSRYEGLSMTLLEALLAEVPIIASDVGGNKEVLGNAGLLYESNNSLEFLTKIKEVMLDDTFKNSLLRECIGQAAKFSRISMVNNYLGVLND